MIVKTKADGASTKREINVTRSINAPRKLVFRAWTDPKQLAQWWGPHGFTNPVLEMEAYTGGSIRIVMRGPDGAEYQNSGIVCEVQEPEKLIFTTALEGERGNILVETLNIVTFSERGVWTQVAVSARVINFVPEAAAMLDEMEDGLTQSLERLDDLLTKVPASLLV